MPIIKAKPTVEPTVVQSIPTITAPEIKSNVVDTKYTPLSSLITYVEGSFWKCTYYSQVIDKSNDLRGQDPGQNGVYQQYKKIVDMELKVNNPLSWSQSSDTKMFTANGNATVHSFLIPNEGDMFAADVGDGREGIFQITLSEKKSILKDSAYYIEYNLVYFSDTNTNRKADLDNKVVVTYHYMRDFMRHGQNPLIITSDYAAINQLKNLYAEMTYSYFDWFFSKEYSTLELPGQTLSTYDHFVTLFVTSILDSSDDPRVKEIRRLNTDDDYAIKQPQLFQAILRKDINLLKMSNKKMGLLSTRAFSYNPVFESIRYSGLNYIVYPQEPNQMVDAGRNLLANGKGVSGTTLTEVPTLNGNISDIIQLPITQINGADVYVIKPVLTDDFYVLSQSFYENTTGQSLLEDLVRNYLNNSPIDPKLLVQVATPYFQFGGLERFYYVPIILALIKSSILSF